MLDNFIKTLVFACSITGSYSLKSACTANMFMIYNDLRSFLNTGYITDPSGSVLNDAHGRRYITDLIWCDDEFNRF